MAYSRSFTNDEIKHRVLNVYAKFVSDVEPDRLSDWLVQENVMSIDEVQRIRNTNHTAPDRCRALLSHLFTIQHPKAFLVVRDALSERNHHLLEYIDNQRPDVQLQTGTVVHDKDKTEQPETDKEDQETAWEADNDRLLKMQKDYDAQTIAWNSEKDRLLKMLTEHEDDKRAWELEKDRLLKMITEQEAQKRTMDAEIDRLLKTSKELETKVCPANNAKEVLNPSSSNTDCSIKLAVMKKLLCTELTDLLKDEGYFKIRHMVERPTIKDTDLEKFWSLALPYIIQRIKTWNGSVLAAQNIAAMVERTQKKKRTRISSDNVMHGSTVYPISRLDCLAYIINAADCFVLQDILRIMSKFPMAMPLVIPDITENGKYIAVAPAMQNIIVKWESTPGHIVENHLFSSPFRMTCAVRLGTNKVGKSTILNQLFSKQFMFSSCGEPGSRYGRPLTLDGTVEIVWLTRETCSDNTWKTTVSDHYKRTAEEIAILANLHGDALRYSDTLKYLEHLGCSFIVFQMPNSTDDEFNQLRKSISSQNFVQVFVDPKENLSDMETIYTDFTSSDDALETVESLLRDSLVTHLSTNLAHPKPLYDLENSKSLIYYSESLQCKEIEEILYIVKVQGCVSIQQLLLNIDVQQHTRWNESLKRLLRSLLAIFKLEQSDAKKSLAHLEIQLAQLSAEESVNARAQVSKAKEKLRRIILKVKRKLTLEENSEESQYQAEFEKAHAELKSAMEKVDGINLGHEHFFRSLGQMYEKSFGCGFRDLGDFSSIRDLPSRYADLLISGHAIEILNGDSGKIVFVWIKSICENVAKKLQNLRIFVISTIGFKTSGKSTLLNASFSCIFAAAVERCSRGLFMRMILIDEEIRQIYGCDAIILIDTEGLCSPEKMNNPKAEQKDRLMATFAMGVSNLTIVNTFGGGMTEVTDVFRTVIAAMARLRRVGIKPDIRIVQYLQERNLSNIDQVKGQFCDAINKAFELIIENDMEIVSASHEFVTLLIAGIKSGDILAHFGSYSDIKSPPSETYHEDVVRLQELLLKRTHTLKNKSSFERWSNQFESYWRYARGDIFTFEFELDKHRTDILYFEEKVSKVKQLYAGSMLHHIAFCANKIREQVKLAIENKQKIRTDEICQDAQDNMEHTLQTIPHDCFDTCGMCKEFKSHYTSLLQEIESKEWIEKTRHSLEECNRKFRKISIEVLKHTFDKSVIRQRFFYEFSGLITRELKQVLEKRPAGQFSTEEQREIVDSIWQFLQCIATSKESTPDLHTRMTQALFREYVYSGILPNILQDLASEISVADLLKEKATKCFWSKFGFGNENLTEFQMNRLISDLGELVEAILKRRGEDCFTTGLDFDEEMITEIKTKFPYTIKEFEECFDTTLYDGFKMLIHIYTLQRFRNLMTGLQNLWNRQNNPSHILLQKKDDYVNEIETRLKYCFSSAGEGEVAANRLCKSIKWNVIQDAMIQASIYATLTTNSEEMPLNYFDKLDKQVAAFESVLHYLDNHMQSIKPLSANEVNSLDSEESVLETYRSIVKHVKQQILNSDNKAEIEKIVKEQMKNTDDRYCSQLDPKDDDFDAFRSSIVRILDSFIESEDSKPN